MQPDTILQDFYFAFFTHVVGAAATKNNNYSIGNHMN